MVNDVLGGEPIVLAIAPDRRASSRSSAPTRACDHALRGDSLVRAAAIYSLAGTGSIGLEPIFASQEFWHSWRTFHPATKTY